MTPKNSNTGNKVYRDLIESNKMIFKTIKYRGGLVSFNIPQHWIEEYETDGGGTFYDDIPNSGTLRLNVLTVQSKFENDNLSEIFKEKQKAESLTMSKSHNGDEIFEGLTRTSQDNIPITFFSFNCIHKTQQRDYLLALFTWTIDTKFEKQEKHIRELRMVRDSIHQLKFGR